MPNTVPLSLAQTSFPSVMPELLKIVLHLLTDQPGSSSRNLTPFYFSIWCQHGGHLQKEVKMASNHCFI